MQNPLGRLGCRLGRCFYSDFLNSGGWEGVESGANPMKSMKSQLIRRLSVWIILLSCSGAFAADPPKNTETKPRTGRTETGFGGTTSTRWSDGARTTTRPTYNGGSSTTYTDKSGKSTTGRTETGFGGTTTTRWSDGSKTTSRPTYNGGSSESQTPGKNSTLPKTR